MARVLVAWELGGGLGHLIRWRPLLQRLRKTGHSIDLALRELARADALYPSTDYRLHQAPVNLGAEVGLRPVRSFTDILHNTGFDKAAALTARCRAWGALYESVRPDLVIFDHSPTALLAARGRPFRKAIIGNGFISPPPVDPLPAFAPSLDEGTGARQDKDAQTLRLANNALDELGAPGLASLGELFRVDDTFLLSFPELDPFAAHRQGVESLGSYPGQAGTACDWPPGQGPRIFAYLRPFASLPSLIERLQTLGLPTLVYGLGVDTTQLPKAANIRFLPAPVSMNSAVAGCQLAICNATHGTVCHMLLGGIPLLLLPINFHTRLTARCVEQMGAGLAAAQLKPAGMAAKLDRLLAEPAFAQAAGRFAARYAGRDLEQQTDLLFARTLALLETEKTAPRRV